MNASRMTSGIGSVRAGLIGCVLVAFPYHRAWGGVAGERVTFRLCDIDIERAFPIRVPHQRKRVPKYSLVRNAHRVDEDVDVACVPQKMLLVVSIQSLKFNKRAVGKDVLSRRPARGSGCFDEVMPNILESWFVVTVVFGEQHRFKDNFDALAKEM